jgi:hypothetical protein
MSPANEVVALEKKLAAAKAKIVPVVPKGTDKSTSAQDKASVAAAKAAPKGDITKLPGGISTPPTPAKQPSANVVPPAAAPAGKKLCVVAKSFNDAAVKGMASINAMLGSNLKEDYAGVGRHAVDVYSFGGTLQGLGELAGSKDLIGMGETVLQLADHAMNGPKLTDDGFDTVGYSEQWGALQTNIRETGGKISSSMSSCK